MKKTNRRSRQTSAVDSSSSSLSQSPAVDDKEHYEKRVHELEQENNTLKREIEELRFKVASVSSTPDVAAQKLKEAHLEKMNALEGQVLELKKKLELQFQFSTQKPKGDEAAKRFQDEIQKLRVQKVQLQCKLKLEAVQFRLCKASLQKEIFQLMKENRRNEYELHLLSALNQRLKLVLQRKTKEAFEATKRLKELLESRKALTHRTAGSKTGNHSQFQSIEHELEVTVQVQKVSSEYEHELEEMAGVINKLKLEAEMLKEENSRCLLEDGEFDPGVKDSEFSDLKEEVARLSNLISQMAVPKAEIIHNKSEVGQAQSSASVGSSTNLLETDTSESEFSGVVVAAMVKPASGVCCSCSKKSSCKTSKCECRVSGGSCGTSCGCAANKCTNRELGSVETEMTSSLTSEGAMLLQNSLIEKPLETKDDCCTRKQPLREIGNKLIKSISLKPGHRKKGQKTVSEHHNIDSPC
ncbi:kinesin-like protein KIN-4C [Citrus sinensis]|uniref:kinesin-like protein KIN-4C n=1 Tax=Citrus sinensis TaxID=2711 RepID=UPI000CED5980|nr:kinesin-like protein KIN-4C [Citrus sinensis]XP_024040313.1 kinesin-like protein KIN-4C isoform X2 [Citrus x clementina]XP_052297813.1 kinesin-like protein KIN-4C [Citrus sinensis]KAH9690353.1 kinesin-like protein KIN-4C [Citrus sinensis]